MPYYRVNDEALKAKILDLMEQRNKQLNKARRWAKLNFNAEGILVCGFQQQVTGIVMSDQSQIPGPDWKRVRSNPKHWIPKRTKAGKEVTDYIRTEFDAPTVYDVEKLVGLKTSDFGHMGVWTDNLKGKRIVLFETSPKWKYRAPKGIERISDIEYEAITKEKA